MKMVLVALAKKKRKQLQNLKNIMEKRGIRDRIKTSLKVLEYFSKDRKVVLLCTSKLQRDTFLLVWSFKSGFSVSVNTIMSECQNKCLPCESVRTNQRIQLLVPNLTNGEYI